MNLPPATESTPISKQPLIPNLENILEPQMSEVHINVLSDINSIVFK